PGRIKQIGLVAGIVRKQNPKALPIVIGSAILIIAAFVVAGLLTGTGRLIIPLGVLVGVSVGMLLFGRFAQSAQYAAIAGQPGAAAAIMQSMRGNWTVTPAVSANRNMDVVHRAVGRTGVVLVGEGTPHRPGRADFRRAGWRREGPDTDPAAAAAHHETAAQPQGASRSRPEFPA